MSKKIKITFCLAGFLTVLFFSLSAKPGPVLNDEKPVKDVIKKVYPSVVRVEARNGTRKVATGVIIDKDGHIVTTALISPRDEEIFIITSDGEKIEGEFMGMDSMTHLALIKSKGKKLTPISIGKTEDVSAGSWIGVVSISPENKPAITQGIVSSVGRDTLRLNVWVVPGTSGSPVVDSKGHMIGLVRGIYSDSMVFEFGGKETGSTGYLFHREEGPSSAMVKAVPIHIVETVVSEIKKKGKVERGWIGVSIVENENREVEIVNIEDESPAELANLEKGDIILEFDGIKITSTDMLADEIRRRKPGDNVSMKIEREGKTKDIKVKLGVYSEKNILREFELKFPRLFPPKLTKPIEPRVRISPKPEIFRWNWTSRNYVGVYIEELNKELSEYFGLKGSKGLLVSKVSKDSPAEKAGLKVGDVIFRADGKEVETLSELSRLIQKKDKGDSIKIEFLRDKKKKVIEVEIAEEDDGDNLFFSKNWEDVSNFWKGYSEKFEKQYKEHIEQYYSEAQKKMKKLSEEINKKNDCLKKEITEKKKDAEKEIQKVIKGYRCIRV